uniref:Uncharacterized protein n=1 Tax=Timema cristinae TaxID=61476 RepID=A0A7R9H7L8_TIMCR|nr:unnamed protein product [Timema cristinae]
MGLASLFTLLPRNTGKPSSLITRPDTSVIIEPGTHGGEEVVDYCVLECTRETARGEQPFRGSRGVKYLLEAILEGLQLISRWIPCHALDKKE